MTSPEADLERSYDLHGVRVRTQAADTRLAERLHVFLVHLGLEPRAEPWAEADIELCLDAGGPAPVEPGQGWQPVPEMAIQALREADRVAVRDDHASFAIELGTGRADGVVRIDRDGTPLLHMNLASYALLTLLRLHRLFPLHAAAVNRNEVGVLLVADSGGGKSTLAANLLLAGWQFLTDDSLLLRSSEGGVDALGLRRDLFLRPGEGPLTDSPDPEPWPDPAKVRIDARRRFPDRVAARCRPRLLVFPEIVGQADSRIEPCSPTEALRLLAHHSLVAELEPSRAPQHMATLADLVNQCVCHRLLAGRDLLDDSGLIARMLTPLCENSL